jgi:flagellar hook-associated protein 2
MASAVSFQGLSTGLQTDALVNAIIAQEGKTVDILKARQVRNSQRTSALTAMKSAMNLLTVSLAAFQDKLNARTVTSTDPDGTNVTATGSGAGAGSYDLTVATVATKGRISPTLVDGVPQNLAVADPAAAIFTSAKASFAVRGTDGVIKAFQLTNNSLNGLRDAINASGAGVTASIVNTGSGANPYQLVVTAKETGTGTTSGVVTLAAIDNEDGGGATTLKDGIGITGGTLTGTFASPGELTDGLQSGASGIAKNSLFSLNGIELTRQTNVVKDAVDGITFTLKKGGQTGTTTLTVAQDKATATTGLQDVLTKFNALQKAYKDASTSVKNEDGSISQAPLAGDATSAAIIAQLRSTLTGASAGLPTSSAFPNLASLGVKTNSDGTLTLNTTTFQAAIEKDPVAALRLLTFTGDSTNGVLAFKSAGAKTVTGSVGFTIDSYTPGGAVSGTFTGTANGPITLTGSNGTLIGGPGDLEGLTVSVTALGSGILTLSRGAGMAASDLIAKLTATGTGSLSTSLKGIETQNKTLDIQLMSAQSTLDRRKKILQAQFAKMEVAIGQMKAASGQLSSL